MGIGPDDMAPNAPAAPEYERARDVQDREIEARKIATEEKYRQQAARERRERDRADVTPMAPADIFPAGGPVTPVMPRRVGEATPDLVLPRDRVEAAGQNAETGAASVEGAPSGDAPGGDAPPSDSDTDEAPAEDGPPAADEPPAAPEPSLDGMSAEELRAYAETRSIKIHHAVTKAETIREKIVEAMGGA